MNKKKLKIAGLALGLFMAVAGVGIAVGANAVSADPKTVLAAENDVHDLNRSQSTVLNNSASIPSINISSLTYYIKKVTLNVRYNKSLTPGVTISVSVGGVSWGSLGVNGTGTNYVDKEFTGDAAIGDISITFTNHSGTGNGKGTFWVASVKVTEAATPAAQKPIESFSGISLNKTTVPLNYSKPLTATATFAPADTDELVSWSSSDDSVATIVSSGTNGVGNISLQGEGTCTFTASNAAGDITYESAVFTVTAAEVAHAYNLGFEGSGENDGTTDLTTSFVDKMTGDASAITATAGTKVYNGKEHTLKFSSRDVDGTISLTAGDSANPDAIKMVILEAKGFGGTDESYVSVKVGSNDTQTSAQLSADKFQYYAFTFASAATNTTVQISATKRLYVRNITLVVESFAAEQGAYAFAANLLNSTDAACGTLDAAALQTAWSSLNSAYATMGSNFVGSQAFFKGVEKNANGNLVEKAAARYDYIVGKYLKTLGNESFVDFANRDPAGVSGLGSVNRFNTSSVSESAILIVSVVGVAAAAAVALYFIQRKRRKSN